MKNLYHALVVMMHNFIFSQSENDTNNEVTAMRHAEATIVE